MKQILLILMVALISCNKVSKHDREQDYADSVRDAKFETQKIIISRLMDEVGDLTNSVVVARNESARLEAEVKRLGDRIVKSNKLVGYGDILVRDSTQTIKIIEYQP